MSKRMSSGKGNRSFEGSIPFEPNGFLGRNHSLGCLNELDRQRDNWV